MSHLHAHHASHTLNVWLRVAHKQSLILRGLWGVCLGSCEASTEVVLPESTPECAQRKQAEQLLVPRKALSSWMYVHPFSNAPMNSRMVSLFQNILCLVEIGQGKLENEEHFSSLLWGISAGFGVWSSVWGAAPTPASNTWQSCPSWATCTHRT